MSWIGILSGAVLMAAGLVAVIYASILWAPVVRLQREEEAKMQDRPRLFWTALDHMRAGEAYVAKTGDAGRVRIARVAGLAGMAGWVVGGLIALLQLHLPK
jgi:hypothetical protein